MLLPEPAEADERRHPSAGRIEQVGLEIAILVVLERCVQQQPLAEHHVDAKRLRDGKDIHYLEQNVVKVIWPLAKVTLIEVLESEDEENLIGFVRE